MLRCVTQPRATRLNIPEDAIFKENLFSKHFSVVVFHLIGRRFSFESQRFSLYKLHAVKLVVGWKNVCAFNQKISVALSVLIINSILRSIAKGIP
jgi:hypothetical protein